MAELAPSAPVTYAKGGWEWSSDGRTIIRWPEVHRRTGRSRTQAWRDIRNSKFPAPIQLGPNAIGWYEDEIEDWQNNRPRVAYAAEAASPTHAPQEEPPGGNRAV